MSLGEKIVVVTGATGALGRVVGARALMLDGLFFGIIYAKTHNLAVTWMTHYIADVMGIFFIVTLARL